MSCMSWLHSFNTFQLYFHLLCQIQLFSLTYRCHFTFHFWQCGSPDCYCLVKPLAIDVSPPASIINLILGRVLITGVWWPKYAFAPSRLLNWLGKRTVQWVNAGGTWTLKRFHYCLIWIRLTDRQKAIYDTHAGSIKPSLIWPDILPDQNIATLPKFPTRF